MKAVVVLAAAASAALVSAQPHGHQHFHQKRVPTSVTTVEGATETAYAYELDGSVVSADEVCAGIADGSLVWEGSEPADACASASSIAAAPTTTATVEATSSAAATTSASAAEFYEESSSSASSSAQSSSSSVASVASSTSASASASSSTASTSSSSSDSGDWSNFTSSAASSSYPNFVDGTILCSDGPPLEYGAIYVDFLDLNGWSGIQQIDSDGDLLATVTECTAGTSCSYACAPSWQKYQWLSTQPSDGASIGGLLCKSDGYLYKANDNDQLCSQGTGDVYLQNEGSSGLSLCRTDYPGTESETIPLYIGAGVTEPVTCPIESEYYEHEGDLTSAEYYLNDFGVFPDVACTWDGSGNDATGNWAPVVLGVGSTDDTNWLSIQQNTPTSYAAFTGTVEIVGDSCSGVCKYSNGEYCLNGEDCEAVTTDGAGCTVSCTGTATFVVSS